MFVTSYSSIQSAPASQVFKITHRDATVEGVLLTPAGWVVEPKREFILDVLRRKQIHFLLNIAAMDKDYQSPELFSHTISSGDKIYGMMFKPKIMVPGKKYPVVLSVYGGPEVQLVTNTFKVCV
jgi:dipeptidyl aminopeptidase/acylaminoacyl peptidase